MIPDQPLILIGLNGELSLIQILILRTVDYMEIGQGIQMLKTKQIHLQDLLLLEHGTGECRLNIQMQLPLHGIV
jgi:hypothetical protein